MFKTTILAALLIVVAGSLPLSAAGSVIILDYHTFLGSNASTLDYSEVELAAKLDKMRDMGYKFISLEDAMAGKAIGKANIVITIDDGNHSVYPAVKNVFEPRGIKPFLFVYAGIINQRRFALKTQQLLELMQAGCGVGAHGWFHEYMTPAAWRQDPAKVLLEANNSRPALAKIIGKAPTMFAYPFGVSSPHAQEALVKAGFEWIFLADTAITPVDFSDPKLDRLAIRRTLVFRWNDPVLFRALADRLK